MKQDWILFFLFLLYICLLNACKSEDTHTVLELFPESHSLSQKKVYDINEDSIAVIEGLVCDGENLIVYDYHSNSSYTLFDEKTGEYIARFGTIGQGPIEIPVGCYGYLLKGCFSVFDDQTRIVMKYNLDSLRSGKVNAAPKRLTKYDIPDAQISRLIAINDSTFFSAGTYRDRYQYLLFDKNSKVLDYSVDIYNVADSTFNKYTKFLSNQGDLIMHPEKQKFACSINFSSNIDFFEIVDNEIKLTKSLRLGNPTSQPVTSTIVGGGMYCSVDLTENSQIGYINLCATGEYVYALYSEKKAIKSTRKSNVVLVFDWSGNPVKKYLLDTDAYYIAVDETEQSMFAAVKNSERGWSIQCYNLQ